MPIVASRTEAPNITGGIIQIDLPDITAETGWKSYYIVLEDYAGGGTSDASLVAFTPYLTISSNNVQDAIQEILDDSIEIYGISVTIQALLEDTANWDEDDGTYIGDAIIGTHQGQRHYDADYFFEAVDDNVWIRLIRG